MCELFKTSKKERDMSTLIFGIICMIVGYYLGTKETDKKWVEKGKSE
jgi:glucose uptake protein GlcU